MKKKRCRDGVTLENVFHTCAHIIYHMLHCCESLHLMVVLCSLDDEKGIHLNHYKGIG